jgi:hypothetical protein
MKVVFSYYNTKGGTMKHTANTGCKKLSVSLFEKDIEHIKKIQVALVQKGQPMLSTSQALKVALRSVDLATIERKAGAILKALKEEDGRGK